VELNNTVILRDNIPEGPITDLLANKRTIFEQQIEGGGWDDLIKPPGINSPERFPRNKVSGEMPLDGGSYVPIKVKIVHSVHNSLHEDGNSWV